MKTRNLMLAAFALFVLALPSCATLKTSEAEQEEIVSQIQKEDATNPVHSQRAHGQTQTVGIMTD